MSRSTWGKRTQQKVLEGTTSRHRKQKEGWRGTKEEDKGADVEWWQGMAKGWQEGRQTIQVEVRAEDGLPGGGRQTESRVETMEGGAKEETGGARADQMEGGAREKTTQQKVWQ